MGYLVFCTTDENGNIIDAACGYRIVPEKSYDHFFFLENEIDVNMKKVENSELVDL